jgi:hypothetical protein
MTTETTSPTNDLHPRWPGTDEPILLGHVGLVYVDGETPYHLKYGPAWWVGSVDEINRDVIRFGCGEQQLSELMARIPELTAGRVEELEHKGVDLQWESASEAVEGLRAIGVEPPASLLAMAEAEVSA